MNEQHREAMQALRRLAARRRAAVLPAVGEGPLAYAEPVRAGVARVLSYDPEQDRYGISEQWWNEDTKEYEDASAPMGLVSASARDYANCAHGVVGQIVRFWQQRRQGGVLETLIDVSGSWRGVERVSSFCVHYSGLNETTDPFHSVPECKFSHIEIDVELRECTGQDHPALTAMDVGGWGGIGISCNLLWSWAGGDWRRLTYRWRDATGGWSSGEEALGQFCIECRVTGQGSLEFRVVNQRQLEGNTVHAIMVGRIRIVPLPPPPGTLEIGNCCCHFPQEE